MANTRSPLMVTLGLVVALTASVTFGVLDIEVLDNALSPIAAWVFIGGFTAVYLMSDRQINQLTDLEAVGFVIPIIAAIGMEHVTPVQNFVTDYSPWGGLALTALTFAGFYALSTDMSLQYISLELVIGSILITTAAVQFDVLEIQVLENHITDVSVWVFFVALTAAYLVSERSIGSLNNVELTGLLVGIGAFAGYDFVPEIQNWITTNNPHAGIGLTVIVLIGYFIVMNNGKFDNPLA